MENFIFFSYAEITTNCNSHSCKYLLTTRKGYKDTYTNRHITYIYKQPHVKYFKPKIMAAQLQMRNFIYECHRGS